MNNETKMTIIAKNSLGRDKVMDLEDYVSRAVTDHRCMAYDAYTQELAEKIYRMQHELAGQCFRHLHRVQTAQKTV